MSENPVFSNLLSEFADVTAHELENANIHPSLARSIGVKVADAIAANFGGASLYIPRNAVGRSATRDREIAQEMAESGALATGIKFGISTTAVYRAAKRDAARRSPSKRI